SLGALDCARDALADPDAGDLDRVARLEGLDRDRLADDELASPAELDEVAMRFDAGLLQVADLGLRDLALGDGLERELDGLVAVGLDGLDLDHGARARLDDGDGGHDAALLVEELRHPELSADDALHLRA